MTRPSPPGSMYVNGSPESEEKITKNTDGTVVVSAIIDDPNRGQDVRLMVRWTPDHKFTRYYTVYSPWGRQNRRASVTISWLQRNTRYFLRAWTQDRKGAYSETYNSSNFWTDRYPNPPVIVAPAENATFNAGDTVPFDWHHYDPDGGNPSGFQVAYRTSGTPLVAPGPWKYVTHYNANTFLNAPGSYFGVGLQYDWQVRTRDDVGVWGYWSPTMSFTIEGGTKPPLIVQPGANTAVITDQPATFKWLFRDMMVGATQATADIQYRVVGSPTWISVASATTTEQEYVFPEDTFVPGYQYEWQVRTHRSTGLDPISDWSASGYFWTIVTPGSLATVDLPTGDGIQGTLGCGTHRVFIFDRGGLIPRGEVTPLAEVVWHRKRDDISDASITVTGFDSDCGELLGSLRSWRHEVKVYRDEDVVFEGPITHLTYRPGEVVIGAKDVMAYVYRRVLRQGYNDSYHLVDGVQLGMKTVVERAGLITVNCLGYADPNVLPYLTLFQTGSDTIQSRIVPDYTKTAWEEIDDLAANAGLDYTTVGRRIIYWDTHHHLGILPEMRDDQFSEPPTVTEYGMNLANFYAVTDGQGNWGSAIPAGKTEQTWAEYYGPIEQLASGYGDVSADPTTLTPAALVEHKNMLTQQARRNINGRFPAPLVARVPDNSTISADVPITINQLIPGVWIPLRVENIVRPFAQVQKLDSVTVTENADGETVQVVMSPAPAGWDDPDASSQDDEESV